MTALHLRSVFLLMLGLFTLTPLLAAPQAPVSTPLAADTVRISIQGTSNIHDYVASATEARLVRARVSPLVGSEAFWTEVTRPGELQEFEIAVRVTALHSDRDGLDSNMYKALKADQFPEITFRLSRLDAVVDGVQKAIGVLRVAGVERQVTLDVKFDRRSTGLVVTGRTLLLMTDFGIAPPRALLGMLRTDPKVTITFEAVLSIPAA